MTDSPLEPLDLLDTDYADILANSSHPSFEMQLVRFGVDAAEARVDDRGRERFGPDVGNSARARRGCHAYQCLRGNSRTPGGTQGLRGDG